MWCSTRVHPSFHVGPPPPRAGNLPVPPPSTKDGDPRLRWHGHEIGMRWVGPNLFICLFIYFLYLIIFRVGVGSQSCGVAKSVDYPYEYLAIFLATS